ncbi:hypothetical protein STEG23_011138 [Scotinomys teguina]
MLEIGNTPDIHQQRNGQRKCGNFHNITQSIKKNKIMKLTKQWCRSLHFYEDLRILLQAHSSLYQHDMSNMLGKPGKLELAAGHNAAEIRTTARKECMPFLSSLARYPVAGVRTGSYVQSVNDIMEPWGLASGSLKHFKQDIMNEFEVWGERRKLRESYEFSSSFFIIVAFSVMLGIFAAHKDFGGVNQKG